jgi:hypothetical protein
MGSEPFICYELLRAKPNESALDRLMHSAKLLEHLADKARREGHSQLAERIALINNSLQSLLRMLELELEKISKSIDELMSSELCGLGVSGICTSSELYELARQMGRRGVIECFKRNIVACRDVTSEFVDLEPDTRAIEAVYYFPNGQLNRAIVLHGPGKRHLRPDALAVVEKCLGVNTSS